MGVETDQQSYEPIDLVGIADRLNRATPGPWYSDTYHDDWAMSMVVVTTLEPSPGLNSNSHRSRNFPTGAVIAATLVQAPGCGFCHALERWDEDSQFIERARTDVEILLAELIRLREQPDLHGHPPGSSSSSMAPRDGIDGSRMASTGTRTDPEASRPSPVTDFLGHEPIDLDGIASRVGRATPSPWYSDVYQDGNGDPLVVVTTQRPNPDHHLELRWPDFPHDAVVAATLVQTPGAEFRHASRRHDENAEFIAHARTDVGVLLAELIRLRAIIDANRGPLRRPGNARN